MGCKGIWLKEDANLGAAEIADEVSSLQANTVALSTLHWKEIYMFLKNEKSHG